MLISLLRQQAPPEHWNHLTLTTHAVADYMYHVFPPRADRRWRMNLAFFTKLAQKIHTDGLAEDAAIMCHAVRHRNWAAVRILAKEARCAIDSDTLQYVKTHLDDHTRERFFYSIDQDAAHITKIFTNHLITKRAAAIPLLDEALHSISNSNALAFLTHVAGRGDSFVFFFAWLVKFERLQKSFVPFLLDAAVNSRNARLISLLLPLTEAPDLDTIFLCTKNDREAKLAILCE